jgi:hypothetical protein
MARAASRYAARFDCRRGADGPAVIAKGFPRRRGKPFAIIELTRHPTDESPAPSSVGKQ